MSAVSLHLEANVTIYLGHGVNQICGKCRKKSHVICGQGKSPLGRPRAPWVVIVAPELFGGQRAPATLGCRTLKLGPGKHGQAGFCRAAAAMAAALILDSVRC